MNLGRVVAVVLGLAFAGLALALKPAQFGLLVVAGVAASCVLRRPIWGLILFALVATSAPYTTIQIGMRTTVSEALLLLTWMGIACQFMFGRLSPTKGDDSVRQAVIWLVLYSVIPLVVGGSMVHAAGSSLSNWLRWILNVSVFFMVPILLQRQADRERVVVAFLSGTLCLLLLSIYYFLKTRNAMDFIPVLDSMKYVHPAAIEDIFSANHRRMASPWVHPNLTGGALALAIPLAVFYGWTRVGWRRVLGLSVALLGCAGLLFSISRGAIVALACVLFWLSYKRVPYSIRVIGIAAILGVILILFYPPLQERLGSMFSVQNASTEVRILEYQKFPEAMVTYPLGIGFKVDPPVPDSGLLGISNLWLNYIYKIGLPGLLLFVLIIMRWWQCCRPQKSTLSVTAGNAIGLGCMCAVLSALGTGLFDHYYSFTFVIIALFWLMVGISIQECRQVPIRETQMNPETAYEASHTS